MNAIIHWNIFWSTSLYVLVLIPLFLLDFFDLTIIIFAWVYNYFTINSFSLFIILTSYFPSLLSLLFTSPWEFAYLTQLIALGSSGYSELLFEVGDNVLFHSWFGSGLYLNEFPLILLTSFERYSTDLAW